MLNTRYWKTLSRFFTYCIEISHHLYLSPELFFYLTKNTSFVIQRQLFKISRFILLFCINILKGLEHKQRKEKTLGLFAEYISGFNKSNLIPPMFKSTQAYPWAPVLARPRPVPMEVPDAWGWGCPGVPSGCPALGWGGGTGPGGRPLNCLAPSPFPWSL